MSTIENNLYLPKIKNMFSNSFEYGHRVITSIAQQTRQNNKMSLPYISEENNSPQAFTIKISQKITKVACGFEILKDKLYT